MDTTIEELIESWRSGNKVPCEQLINYRDLSQEQQLELICMELLIRRERGESPKLEEFLARFPQYQKELEAHFALEDFLSTEAIPESRARGEPIDPYGYSDWPLSVRAEVTHPLSVGNGWNNLTEEFDTKSEFSNTDDPSMNLAGRRFGDYVLLRVLGKGGMGLVFEARQISLNRTVALKMMRGDWQNEKGRKQFKREAQAIAGLDYPHIVKILDAGEVNGNPYYTMNVMTGGSLAEHLDEFTGQTRKAVELVATIAEALGHVHDQGIVHRDIKHSNILLDTEKQPHLSDFGLCRDLQHDPSTTIANGNVIGTPMFLAPEQIETGFGKISPATDVYALGVVLFHLVAGHPPFDGKSVMQVLWGSVHKEPDFQEVPEMELAKILRGCLAKRPSERYENAGKLAEQLNAWLGRQKVTRPILGRMMQRFRRLKQKTKVALVGIVCLSLFMAARPLFEFFNARQDVPTLESTNQELVLSHKARKQAEEIKVMALTDAERARQALAMEKVARVESTMNAERLREMLAMTENGLIPKQNESQKLDFLTRFEERKLQALQENLVGDSEVLAVCFSSDGAYMAWSDMWGNVKIRHRVTLQYLDGQPLQENYPVWTLAFHPQRNILAWGSQGGVVTLFDLATKTRIASADMNSTGVGHVEFTRDGKHLICACADSISTWNADDLLAQGVVGPNPIATRITHSSNFPSVSHIQQRGQIVSAGDDGYIRIWDWKNGREVRSEPVSQQRLQKVVVSPDGKMIATGGEDGFLRLLESDTLKLIHQFSGSRNGNWIRGLAFSPDGSRLVSTSEFGEIRLWDVLERRELSCIPAHKNQSMSIAFAPDGTRFATAGHDHKCRVWDLEKIEEDGYLSIGESAFQSLSVGSRIATLACDDGQIRIIDLRSKRQVPAINTEDRVVRRVAMSPDGTRMVSIGFDRRLNLWDLASCNKVWSVLTEAQDSCGISFSEDSRFLGIGAKNFVYVWDMETLKLHRTILTNSELSNQVAFQPGSQNIAFLIVDPELSYICIHNLITGQDIYKLPENRDHLRAIKFNASGKKIAALGTEGIVKVWEIGTANLACVEKDGSPTLFSCLDFGRQEKLLAVGDSNGYVRLYDVDSFDKPLLSLHQGGKITNVAFSQDGDFLVSTSDNGTVKIWDARPLTEE